MKFVEKTAKTVDDAVTNALLDLMVTRDAVDIEVLDKGSRGFLGLGAKDARVRVTVKAKEPKSVYEELGIEDLKVDLNLDIEEVEEETDEDDEMDPAEIGKKFLADVLENMGIEASIDLTVKKGQAKMIITGNKMGLIIGKRGEHLDALQYLVNLVVNKNSKKYIRVILDTENYRRRRRKTLEKLAYRLGKKASQTKKPVVLEPMTPYDRKIIHSALQNNKSIRTYSEGKEPYRKIVIAPKTNEKENNKS